MQVWQKVWPQGMVTGILKRSRQMAQVKFEFGESIFNHESDTPMEKWKRRIIKIIELKAIYTL